MSANPRSISTPLPEGALVHRVGKLRAGIKVSRMKDNRAIEYPSAVDYFVVKEDQSTSAGAAASFAAKYGDEPKELNVMLPGHRPEDCLEGAWRMYGAGGLLKRKCTGPGGECVTRDDGGDWVNAPCVCAAEGIDPDDKKKHCAERWTLSVVLPDVTGLGVWQFDTGSHMAGEGMAAMLQLIYGFRGSLLRAECKLRLVPKQVAPEGKVKTVYIAVLESEATPRDFLAAGDTGAKLALPPSSLDEEPDEMLDHEQIAAGDVEYEPVEGEVLDYEPVTYDLKALLAEMSLRDRTVLYAAAGIEKGTRTPQVHEKLRATLKTLRMPDTEEPMPAQILALHRRMGTAQGSAEAFDIFLNTGQDIDPGDQVEFDEVMT